MVVGTRLYDLGEDFTHVYFVESGIIGMCVVIDEASTFEVSMVGDEGMVGLPVYYGFGTSKNRAIVQSAGSALRLKVADFTDECSRHEELAAAMQKFAYAILIQITKTAGCNRFHTADTRMARWLLMTADRLKTNTFHITQEFLSYMLGVRREAVNKIARDFGRRELISYSRGNFSITDRKGMEAIVCTCYSAITN